MERQRPKNNARILGMVEEWQETGRTESQESTNQIKL